MRTKHLIVILGFLVLALVCNDIEDTLVHHYDNSIFARFGHESYFYPDWTRLYVGGDPAQGKTFIGEWLPFLLDGWHLFKVIRWWAVGTIVLLLVWYSALDLWSWSYELYLSYMGFPFWKFYGIGITAWTVLVWEIHKLVYTFILIK